MAMPGMGTVGLCPVSSELLNVWKPCLFRARRKNE